MNIQYSSGYHLLIIVTIMWKRLTTLIPT